MVIDYKSESYYLFGATKNDYLYYYNYLRVQLTDVLRAFVNK